MNEALRAAVEQVTGAAVAGAESVGGGCISPAWRARLADGGSVFVKTSDVPRLLVEEARSLAGLAGAARSVEGVLVPEVLGVGGEPGAEWLVLEWMEPVTRAGAEAWTAAGAGLARLHQAQGPRWGWESDNFIGPLPQANGAAGSWAAFWRKRRLEPQLERARQQLRGDLVRRLEELAARLEDVLGPVEAEGPSLLHGDLWSGNLIMTARGAALVDPAAYHGHREVDLAMAALFGGFPRGFFDGYEREWPLQAGWERRRAVYQLYYLLVHVNLFGRSYEAGVERALRQAA